MQLFDGAIAGIGTEEGTRLVVGMWPLSPYGSVTDVMMERPDGQRILLAPSQELADFIAETYTFDEVRVTPVLRVRDGRTWQITSDGLVLTFEVGSRPSIGWLLFAVPRRLARAKWWTSVTDPVARVAMKGVRTRAGNKKRREWYSAIDLHRITAATVQLDGQDLGELRPVDPPVRFGVGSTPKEPSLTRVVSRVAES